MWLADSKFGYRDELLAALIFAQLLCKYTPLEARQNSRYYFEDLKPAFEYISHMPNCLTNYE